MNGAASGPAAAGTPTADAEISNPAARERLRRADEEVAVEEPSPLAGSRELFAIFGIDADRLGRLADGAPLADDERDTALAVLFRLPAIPPLQVQRWTRRGVDWEKLTQTPDAFRCELVTFSGRVVSATAEALPAETAKGYQFSRYTRSRLLLANGRPLSVLARKVPAAWKLDQPIDQRAAVTGVFLKLVPSDASAGDANAVEPLLVADRIAWHPPTDLGDFSFDCGLFDEVRQATADIEPEPFYQLLAAVGRADPEWFREQSRRSFELVPLIQQPAAAVGTFAAFSGTARRAIRVRLGNPDLIERLGFDHYYEVNVFVDLDGYITQIGDTKTSTYPVVCCVRRLPPGMPEGNDLAEPVRVNGFFLKAWSYPTARQAAGGQAGDRGARMVSPLLVGLEPEWITPPPAGGGWLGIATLAAIGVCTVGLLAMVWLFHRQDAKFHAAQKTRRESIDSATLTQLREPS